jgi:hypothetical protein
VDTHTHTHARTYRTTRFRARRSQRTVHDRCITKVFRSHLRQRQHLLFDPLCRLCVKLVVVRASTDRASRKHVDRADVGLLQQLLHEVSTNRTCRTQHDHALGGCCWCCWCCWCCSCDRCGRRRVCFGHRWCAHLEDSSLKESKLCGGLVIFMNVCGLHSRHHCLRMTMHERVVLAFVLVLVLVLLLVLLLALVLLRELLLVLLRGLLLELLLVLHIKHR